MATTTVMRYSTVTTSDYDSSVGGSTSISIKQERRYSQGWKNKQEDHKPANRMAKVLSQDYNAIKHELVAQKAVWEDPTFPANDYSLYPSSHGRSPFKWMRPSVSECCLRSTCYKAPFDQSAMAY